MILFLGIEWYDYFLWSYVFDTLKECLSRISWCLLLLFPVMPISGPGAFTSDCADFEHHRKSVYGYHIIMGWNHLLSWDPYSFLLGYVVKCLFYCITALSTANLRVSMSWVFGEGSVFLSHYQVFWVANVCVVVLGNGVRGEEDALYLSLSGGLFSLSSLKTPLVACAWKRSNA